MSFKNIRIAKRGGGTRLQRVKVLKSGKYKFVKNLIKGAKRSSKTRRKSNPNKRRRKNVTRKNKRKGGKSLQQQAFKWLRVGALAAPALVIAAQPMKVDQKANEILRVYTGVNIKHSMESNALQFDWGRLAMGWLPFLAATLTTYGIPKIAGIIRRI